MHPAQDSPQRFWDARYSEAEPAYGAEPNDFLREKVASLPVGDAICLVEGQGRNAIHLARLGHRVIAQDLSLVGLQQAEAMGRRQGVSLTTLCCDLADWQPEPESVDLVVAIWMHLPLPLRAKVHRQAIAALRPGGHLVLEAYTPEQLDLGSGGPPSRELLVEPQALQQELAGLELLEFGARRRWISEGPYHQGQSAVVQVLGRKP